MRSAEQETQYSESEIRNFNPETQKPETHKATEALNPESGTRLPGHRTRKQETGTWNLQPETHYPASKPPDPTPQTLNAKLET